MRAGRIIGRSKGYTEISRPHRYSYEYITHSVRRGILEDLESHLIHPNLSNGRAGPAVRAAKGTRVPFTAEDDRLLETWVTDFKRRGGRILGNEIYIQLAEVVRPPLSIYVPRRSVDILMTESSSHLSIMAR